MGVVSPGRVGSKASKPKRRGSEAVEGGRREGRSEGNLRGGGGWIGVAEGDSERLNYA